MAGNGLIRSIRLENILSFGPEAQTLELGPLNVLIGPNGSGKSNLLHVLELLRSVPNDLEAHVVNTGGMSEWLWKGPNSSKRGTVEITLDGIADWHMGSGGIKYMLSLRGNPSGQIAAIADENVWMRVDGSEWRRVFGLHEGRPVVAAHRPDQPYEGREDVELKAGEFSILKSVIAQLQDLGTYPEISFLNVRLGTIQLYGVFDVGPESPLRRPELTLHLPGRLASNGANLSSVLNALGKQTSRLEDIERRLRDFYPRVKSLRTEVLANTIQTVIHEQGLEHSIPTSRMSDGMLRYLCLLAILCQPEPPALICLEEPEAGLHPDIIPEVAKLLQEASQRTQLIVTTHSDILVDALSDTPEAIIVTERGENGTEFQRLDKNDLTVWLEKYSLGELWTRGHIGGNRW